MAYTITIDPTVLAPGGALDQQMATPLNYNWVGGIGFVPITPPPATPTWSIQQKARVAFGVFGDYLTYADESLVVNEHPRAVSFRADGTCVLQDEEFEGLSTTDRVVLANLVNKGIAIVTLNGGAPMTGYAVAHTIRF
jgi:hypothetical protein